MMRELILALIVIGGVGVAGCSTLSGTVRTEAPSSAVIAAAAEESPADYDPWEGFNQKMFTFNRQADKYVLKPAAKVYDVVMPEYRGLLTDLSDDELRPFARAIFRILKILGPLPLDYEIHQGAGLPLHAHINGRLYPYSNVAGTLNLPNLLPQNVAALRKALARNG